LEEQSLIMVFQPGLSTILGEVVSNYIMYTTVLHLLWVFDGADQVSGLWNNKGWKPLFWR